MAKISVISEEVEKVIVTKVKEKTGVLLELTAREANLLFLLIGEVTLDIPEVYELYNKFTQACSYYDSVKVNNNTIMLNTYAKQFLNTPLK